MPSKSTVLVFISLVYVTCRGPHRAFAQNAAPGGTCMKEGAASEDTRTNEDAATEGTCGQKYVAPKGNCGQEDANSSCDGSGDAVENQQHTVMGPSREHFGVGLDRLYRVRNKVLMSELVSHREEILAYLNEKIEELEEMETDKRPRVTDKVYFDISIEGEDAGRIVIGVFGEIVPKTAKNFVELAKGTRNPKGKSLHYKGSTFSMAFKYFKIEGGFLPGNIPGGKSIYGAAFDDENFDLKHYGSGWVSMAQYGHDSNACRFSITSAKHKYLDGRQVVFGKVLEGMDVVRRIEFEPTDRVRLTPKATIMIRNSGVLPVQQPFPVELGDVDPEVTFRLKYGQRLYESR